MSTPVETMRRFYEVFEGRDVDAMRSMLDGCVWHVPGENQLAGVYRGAEEIIGLFGKSRELSDGTAQLEMHDCVGDDQHAVGLDHVSGRRSDGRTLDMNRVLIAHMRDGAFTEVWVCPEDQYAFDEFWS
jgi:ketosteroid isomerase-like protein